MALAGDPTIEAALTELAAEIAGALGELLVGIYLEGSFSWGNAVATSDLDLRVVTAGPVDAARQAEVQALRAAAMSRLGRELGVQFEALADLVRVGAVRFQRSRLLYGRDIRDKVPLKPMAAYARDSAVSARRLAAALRERHGQPAAFPLGLPQPALEFRGYEVQPVLDDGRWIPSSKRLVTNVSAVATAWIAASGEYVYSKGEVPAAYQRCIGDGWCPLVDEVFATCRTRDAYRLPADPPSRRRLTALCEQATAFENTLMQLSTALVEVRSPG